MLSSIRFGFVFAGFGVLVLFLGMASVAQAATCTATTGNWNTPGTWSGCGGGIPQAVDDVIVPSNVDVTVNVAGAVANTVTIQNAVGANNSIGINSPGTLTVTGTVSIAASTGAGSSSLSVVDGEVVAAGIIATGGGAAGVSQIVASAGTITSTNGITFAGNAANAQLNTYSSVTIILGGTTGTLGAGGTVSLHSSSTVVFSGTGAQTVNAYDYGNVDINKVSGTATLADDTLIFGSLSLDSGVFDSSTHSLDVTGGTTIEDGATLIHNTGHKIHNGDVLINEGGTWTETGATTIEFLGNVTNNGTFTANTGLHSFVDFERSINGTLSIPSVSFLSDAIYTNNGTLTVSTSLGGDATLINGEGGTLNIGDEIIDDENDGLTFTASAEGNTVNYNRAGAQTVKIPTGGDYGNLTLSGSGTKSVGSALTIAGDLSIESGSKVSLTGDSTSNKLFLNDTLQVPGTFGSSSSNANDRNNTYFAGTGMVTVAVGAEPRSISSGSSASPAMLAKMGITPGGGGADDNQLEIEKLLAQIKELEALLLKLQNGQATVSPNPENFKCEPFLRLGSKGEEVKMLQTKLGILADGVFGKDTEKALRDFQAEKGLMSDGIAGPESCMAV